MLKSGACKKPAGGSCTGGAGVLIFPSANGARFARITARTAPRGNISRSSMPICGRIAGARTASRGICDNHQRLCFALAFWNGRDPILKERLFGLTGNQGNHGEDVKEMLLLPGLHADAFLHEVPVQISAGGVSLSARCSERIAAARARIPNLS